MLAILDAMERQGLDPARSSLRYGIFGAEPWTGEMRAEIEARASLDATDIHGLSEVIGPGVAQVEELILQVPALSPHFQLRLTRPGRMDAMTVHVERRPDADPPPAAAHLATLIKNTIGVTAATIVQDPDTIERSTGKMRRIIDERPR